MEERCLLCKGKVEKYYTSHFMNRTMCISCEKFMKRIIEPASLVGILESKYKRHLEDLHKHQLLKKPKLNWFNRLFSIKVV